MTPLPLSLVVDAPAVPRRWAATGVKRLVDVLAAGALLVVTAPVQACAGLAVVLEDGRPVLYRQRRAGLHGREFDLCKFRTMRLHDTPASTQSQVGLDHPLVTRSGRVLRRLKIDELPQLVSVLRGDMSLVGPRPALPEQAQAYDHHERHRLSVRPGLTGWAQVNGNAALTWPERILLDRWYVDHWSLRLDLSILARTLAVVAGGEKPGLDALERARDHADRTDRRG